LLYHCGATRRTYEVPMFKVASRGGFYIGFAPPSPPVFSVKKQNPPPQLEMRKGILPLIFLQSFEIKLKAV